MKNSESSNDRKIFEHRPKIFEITFFRQLRFCKNVDYVAYRHPCYNETKETPRPILIDKHMLHTRVFYLSMSKAINILTDKE